MCGICGFTGMIEERENTIQKMTEVITHRGPDSNGFYLDDYISMGFRRLSIIDLTDGDQPIENEDGTLVLTFNGEIYNYKQLKTELEGFGHTFKTSTDSEVLLHSFEQWGEEMFEHLRGMFGFAIYNKKTKDLFLARDFFGIKPLHYTVIGDNLVYGSEIKSILEHPQFVKEFNEKALDHYLSFQYCPQPMTFFKDVYCLLPGHFMWFRDGVVETQRYFEAKFKPDEDMTEDEAVDKIEAVFENSVNAHKIADVEVGCFLSSGVDSSYVSTYFKDQKTFTVGFDFGERYNEISWAENLSKELGVEHHTKLISSEEFWAAVPKVQYHMDQPLADPSCIALYFVAKLASEYVKVVLSGEGADELFGGYTCYNDPRVFKVYQKIVPYCIRRAIGAVCKKLPDIKGRDYLIRATHPLEKRFIGNAYMYDQKEKKTILKDASLATDPSKLVRRHYTRARRYDDVTKMQYLDINMWMVGDILLKADRMSMANSLELRVPFLDKEVFKVASTIPTDLRVNKHNTKYAMRQAALRHLPQATAEKEKLGFPVPTRVWLRDEHYYSVVRTMFTSPTAEKFFNTNVLIDYLDEHFIEKEDNSRKIWTIYVFLVWYEIYFGAVESLEDTYEPRETDPSDSPFEDGENLDEEDGNNPIAVESDEPSDDSKTRVFTPVDDAQAKSAPAFVDDEDVSFEEIFSAVERKTAKSVRITDDTEVAPVVDEADDEDMKIVEDTPADDTNDTKVKASFKPTLENHNDFFESLKTQLQETDVTALEAEAQDIVTADETTEDELVVDTDETEE